MRQHQAKEKAAVKRQRAIDTAALISQIDAFNAIYGQSADIELRRKRALVEEEELRGEFSKQGEFSLNRPVDNDGRHRDTA